MRLHHLTVTAFGPFAGTEHVDFEDLNAAGLFLLTGPTGAGKSSLLDAVCFALYGTVPGVRGTKALKSQHAPADAKPEVVLDLTVQGRRLTVRRSPEWSRPKRRGAGVLVEKACASVVETTTGSEHFLTSRAAEVGLLVGELMGMSAGQFVQVALLPQGEFQTFLRASSQDRHDVLQQLFRTDRFARIEDWVADHSRALREQAGVGRVEVQRLLDTAAHRAELPLPEDLAGDRLAAAAAEGRVQAWAQRCRESVAEAGRRSREEDAVAAVALRAARDRHQRAVRDADLRRRAAAARSTLATLAAAEPEAAGWRDRLALHDRASRCVGLLQLRTDARRSAGRAGRSRDEAVGLVGRHHHRLPEPVAPPAVPELTVESLEAVVEELRGRIARLEALAPRERAAADALRGREFDVSRLATVEQELQAAAGRLDRLPGEVDDCLAALSSATAAAGRLEVLTEALEAATRRHEAARELVDLDHRLTVAADDHRDARDRSLAAREQLQDLVARRLAGMAAELAGRLAEGAPCQVCGSVEHPAPASRAEDAVTVEQQQRAEDDVVAAGAALAATETVLRALQGRHDALAALTAGATLEQADAERVALHAEVAAAASSRSELAPLAEHLHRLREEQADTAGRREAAAATLAARHESVAGHDRLLAEVASEVAEQTGGSAAGEPVLSPGQLARSLTTWCEVLVTAGRAVGEADRAERRAAELHQQALAAATEHGFATLPDVEDAVLAEAEVDRLRHATRERDDARAAAVAVLADPEVAAVAGVAGPAGAARPEVAAGSAGMAGDGDAGGSGDASGSGHADRSDHLSESDAAELLATAQTTATEAASRLAVEVDRLAALTGCLERLDDAVRRWAPVRDSSLRAESIARLVRGMGQDNQLQMRLSAYVLATRLDQVVAAANERLGHMREQRYQLQRTGRAERRSSQAGLGLEVVDQWTGDVRAPRTLSGGETFVVSLALALGLADVVTHESGGTEIETLFVDEGFGTLDADTLDDVMDRLDDLRAGGRTVGVVSHVSELRARIPTQVQVDKGRDGSTVRVRTLVG